ncbi:MAG: hypothetical protein R3330_15720 [Saprospiraceae bacterium]|nr:hypothetical protein [Saprospiraceae bacterium]
MTGRSKHFLATCAIGLVACVIASAQFVTTTRGMPEVTVHISEESTLADMRVLFVQEAEEADFSILFTYDANDADYILTRGTDADFVIGQRSLEKADLRIQAGEFVSRPHVTVNVIREGEPDYRVFVDRINFGLNDVVMAILPALNKALDYRFEWIPRMD